MLDAMADNTNSKTQRSGASAKGRFRPKRQRATLRLDEAMRRVSEQLGERQLGLQLSWRQIVGESLSGKSRLLSVGNGVARVEVEDQRWRGELVRHEASLLQELGRHYPGALLRKLVFVSKAS